MTCKDCLHYEVCGEDQKENIMLCDDFKDRSKWVEQKHGRWVHPKGYVVSNGFLCSNCNHEEASHHAIHPCGNGTLRADEHGNFFYPPRINYCPACGALMTEGSEGDGV